MLYFNSMSWVQFKARMKAVYSKFLLINDSVFLISNIYTFAIVFLYNIRSGNIFRFLDYVI